MSTIDQRHRDCANELDRPHSQELTEEILAKYFPVHKPEDIHRKAAKQLVTLAGKSWDLNNRWKSNNLDEGKTAELLSQLFPRPVIDDKAVAEILGENEKILKQLVQSGDTIPVPRELLKDVLKDLRRYQYMISSGMSIQPVNSIKTVEGLLG